MAQRHEDRYNEERQFGREREDWRSEEERQNREREPWRQSQQRQGRWGSPTERFAEEYGGMEQRREFGGREGWGEGREQFRGSSGQEGYRGSQSYQEQQGFGERGGYGIGRQSGGGRELWSQEGRGFEGSRDWTQERPYGESFGQQRLGQQGYGPGQQSGQHFGSTGQGSTFGGSFGQERFGGTETQRGRFSGKGPKGWKRSDDRIEEDINERLTMHPEIDATEIQIEVKNGEVTLRGVVEEKHAKRIAEDIVESVSGVKDVQNQIRVSPNKGETKTEQSGTATRSTQKTGKES